MGDDQAVASASGTQAQATSRDASDPFGAPTTQSGSQSSTVAYFVASSCSSPAQSIATASECDDAARALGLSAGYWPTAAYGGQCAKWDGGWGALSSDSATWYYYYASNQVGAQLICKLP